MTNSADPDQLASSEANWSGSTLFAKTGHVVFSKRRVKILDLTAQSAVWSRNNAKKYPTILIADSKDPNHTVLNAQADLTFTLHICTRLFFWPARLKPVRFNRAIQSCRSLNIAFGFLHMGDYLISSLRTFIFAGTSVCDDPGKYKKILKQTVL